MPATDTLRVFISSTFEDLREEREHLVKKVFPEIRRTCRQRGIDFVDVDLRWGITEEQSREGGALAICLREIDRCRPYFIGILGSRYGWIPGPLSSTHTAGATPESYPWLPTLLADGTSITEIEMRYGALDLSPSPSTDNAFFYFLSPDPARSHVHGEPPDAAQRLEDLRRRIRTSEHPTREGIADATTLGKLVRDDLMRLVERIAPSDLQHTELEKIRASHRAFSTARRHSYLPNTSLLDVLNEFVSSRENDGDAHGRAMIVAAPSGYGKSALLAFWADAWSKAHPDRAVIVHHVGVDGGDHISIIRHLMLEIQERFSVTGDLPIDPMTTVGEFPEWLGCIDSPTILVIDAVNQLRGTALELTWLPRQLPHNVRLVISTTPGETYDRLADRRWRSMELAPLDRAEREKIISRYLGEYSKSLTREQIGAIIEDQKSAVPLFLRTLIEELRVFGEHQQLDERIGYYLASRDTADLFQRVLERLEHDHGKGLVRDVMGLIGVSRNGLSEIEVLEISGATRLAVSSLMLDLDYHLMLHGSLHSFFHDYLREAVASRYTRDAAATEAFRLRIADHFTDAPYDARRRDEEPWQLKRAGQMYRLAECLRRIPMLRLLDTVEHRYELIDYWRSLTGVADMVEEYTRSIEAYERATDDQDEILSTVHDLGHLFIAATRYDAAERLFRRVLASTTERYGHDDRHTSLALDDLGTALTYEGGYAEAEDIFRDVVSTVDRLSPDDPALCTALDNLATVLYALGKYEEFRGVCERSLALSERLFGAEHLQTADRLQNLAGALSTGGNHPLAIQYMERAVAIQVRWLGETHPDTCKTIVNLGGIHHVAGDFDAAEVCYRRALGNLERLLGDHPEVATTILNLAALHLEREQWDEAEVLLQRNIRIRMELFGENNVETVGAHLALGRLRLKLKRFDEAETIYRRYYPDRLRLLGATHPRTVESARSYEEVLMALGREEEAERIRRSVDAQGARQQDGDERESC